MKIELSDKEKIEDLQCEGLKIIQNKEFYTFTSDSVVLANFIKIKKKEVAVEVGSGSGVISILLSKKVNFKHIYGFEIQKELFEMANKSLALNDLTEEISFINDKFQNYKNYFENGSVDVIFSNPPYKKEGSAKYNDNESKAIARHEKNLMIDELCVNVSKLLKHGGRFYVVYDADRCCELIYQLISNKLEPKRMFFTDNGRGKTTLVVIEAVKGGKHGVKVLPTLIVNDREGNYLHEIVDKYKGI